MTAFSPVLLISPHGDAAHAPADAAVHRLGDALQQLGYKVVRASSTDEGLSLVNSHPVFAAVVLDWDLADGTWCSREAALAIVQGIRARSRLLPVFLAVDRAVPASLPLAVARDVHGYLHPLAETPETAARRLDFAVRQYYAGLVSPYLRALKQQIDDGPSLWGGAGHHGGEAFRRHPVGAEFERLFGDLARADIGTHVPELGDWLEHVGAPADSERRSARVFGADWSYLVLGGSSAANRIVVTGTVARDDIVIVDRCCHRSVVHGVMLAGGRPVYIKPPCNGLGMVGPVAPWCLAPGHIRELIDHSPLTRNAASPNPVLAVITNDTYDGLCCDVERVVSTVGQVAPRLHFDEAAFGYAHAHPMYDGRHAMGVQTDAPDRPTLFAVQSTHEMLPALSMASMIHGRSSPRAPVEAPVFNQSFLIHGTTSPFHPILASSDIATAMMELPAGRTLVDEAIRDAIAFRQTMAMTRARLLETSGTDGWFFDIFQPPAVTPPLQGETVPFAEASAEMLAAHASCWTLKPGERWHGFADGDVDADHVLLDPMKVTIICPGADASGVMTRQGIPACVLTRFLEERRIDVARSGMYTALLRFAVGLDQGRWGAIIEALHEFKRFYDGGVTIGEALPKLAGAHPRYANLSLRALCDNMHAAITALEVLSLGREAVLGEPRVVTTPAAGYQELLRGRTRTVPLGDAPDRIAAVIVVPAVPGIPVALPGERIGPSGCAVIRYLRGLEAFNGTFPGFEYEVHGVEHDDDGSFLLRVFVDDRRRLTVVPVRATAHERRKAAGSR
ncbi:MAG TPA: Orn/Lys/Arg decarboxylase N-terminal domain-containing protein [Vicinamibacterales bacterium]|nr:Orn/Lys/Arg decarboxylase N-terminal domain-containing protein [Vicinamibacterales bacterium]